MAKSSLLARTPIIQGMGLEVSSFSKELFFSVIEVQFFLLQVNQAVAMWWPTASDLSSKKASDLSSKKASIF